MGSKRSEVEQKLHHGERNYIVVSEITLWGVKKKEITTWGAKLHYGSEIERKYIMEERNRVMGSEITSWEAKLHYEK